MTQRMPTASETQTDWPEQVIGGKYVRLLRQQLEQLRGENPHGNHRLFLDDVFVVHLLAFFNPRVRTLRTIEDFSQARQIGKHLSVRRICKSTPSDFHQRADPQRLRRQLARKSLDVPAQGNDLQNLPKKTVAVDGTFLPAAADVVWAVANSNHHAAVGIGPDWMCNGMSRPGSRKPS